MPIFMSNRTKYRPTNEMCHYAYENVCNIFQSVFIFTRSESASQWLRVTQQANTIFPERDLDRARF